MNRVKQIDVLRALAVFLVLGRHMDPCPGEVSPLFHALSSVWKQGGWVGVDLFFVLSGFLVSGLLFREHETFSRLDVKRFLIRRGLKIYPAFWLLIAATIVLWIPRYHEVPWLKLAVEMLFVQNYGSGLWTHTWSLAVEEHFYLLLAVGFWLAAKRRAHDPFKRLPFVLLGVAILCLGLRLYFLVLLPFNYRTHLFASHLRLDSLSFGVFLAWLFHRHPLRFQRFAKQFRYVLLVAGIAMLTPAFWLRLEGSPFIYTVGFTLFYLGSGCLLMFAIGSPAPEGRALNAVACAGTHSYSIYLWHVALLQWGVPAMALLFPHWHNWFAYAAAYLAGSVGVGILMSRLIELPALRFRDRFFPSLAGSAKASPPMGDADAVITPYHKRAPQPSITD